LHEVYAEVLTPEILSTGQALTSTSEDSQGERKPGGTGEIHLPKWDLRHPTGHPKALQRGEATGTRLAPQHLRCLLVADTLTAAAASLQQDDMPSRTVTIH